MLATIGATIHLSTQHSTWTSDLEGVVLMAAAPLDPLIELGSLRAYVCDHATIARWMMVEWTDGRMVE
jgi:hypothetical protein